MLLIQNGPLIRSVLFLCAFIVIGGQPASASKLCNNRSVEAFAMGKKQSSVKLLWKYGYPSAGKKIELGKLKDKKIYGIRGGPARYAEVTAFIDHKGGPSFVGAGCFYSKSGKLLLSKPFGLKNKAHKIVTWDGSRAAYFAIIFKSRKASWVSNSKYKIWIRHKDVNPIDVVKRRLDEAMAKKATFSTHLIAKVRGVISKLPAADRGGYYLKLQGKVAYANQCDNVGKLDYETSGSNGRCGRGGSCVLTSVSMAFGTLNIANPDSSVQYEVALDKKVRATIGKSGVWTKIPGNSKYYKFQSPEWWMKWGSQYIDSRITGESISLGKQNKAWWKKNVGDKYLAKGHGVVLSLGGHVVRLQGVTDDGLVVDDPYANTQLVGSSRRTYPNKNLPDTNGAVYGDNNLLSWASVEKFSFSYGYAYWLK